MIRCINLDWLEVFAEEPTNIDLDVSFFSYRGFIVVDRGYGTRMYAQMFTIYSGGEPFIEIRRKPLSVKSEGGIFSPKACHIRLSNRVCYCERPIDTMRSFLVEFGYEFRGISRIDLCLDFERFDEGDNPSEFIRRYIAGKFSKINQSIAKARWEDTWDNRTITWISWGLPSSMVSTKIYLKSRELANVGDKPWIRQAWCESGLIEKADVVDKDIWRVEFSIKGGSAKWVKIENSNDKAVMPNSLDQYESRYKLLFVFFSLADHYFHFKQVVRKEDGSLQRKDRCPDKVLFKFHAADRPYRLTRLTKAVPVTRQILYLLRNLNAYSKTVHDPAVLNSFNDVIDFINCKLAGRERKLRVEAAQQVFEQLFMDDISGKTSDMPFIGDDFESFVLQYTFDKNFLNNKNH